MGKAFAISALQRLKFIIVFFCVLFRIAACGGVDGQVTAIGERLVADACDAGGNCDISQERPIERHDANARDAIGNGDASQACAIFERTFIDACNAVADRDFS